MLWYKHSWYTIQFWKTNWNKNEQLLFYLYKTDFYRVKLIKTNWWYVRQTNYKSNLPFHFQRCSIFELLLCALISWKSLYTCSSSGGVNCSTMNSTNHDFFSPRKCRRKSGEFRQRNWNFGHFQEFGSPNSRIRSFCNVKSCLIGPSNIFVNPSSLVYLSIFGQINHVLLCIV